MYGKLYNIIYNDVFYFSLPLFLVRFCGFMVQLSNARPVTTDYREQSHAFCEIIKHYYYRPILSVLFLLYNNNSIYVVYRYLYRLI